MDILNWRHPMRIKYEGIKEIYKKTLDIHNKFVCIVVKIIAELIKEYCEVEEEVKCKG